MSALALMRDNRLQLGIVPQPTRQGVQADTQSRGCALALFVREQHRPHLGPPHLGQYPALRPEQLLSRLLRQTHEAGDITRATLRSLAPGCPGCLRCSSERSRVVDVIEKTRGQDHPLGTCGLAPRHSHRRRRERARSIDARCQLLKPCQRSDLHKLAPQTR